MRELGLHELLRYALSGGIGLAVLFFTFPKFGNSIAGMEAAKETTLVLGLVLLVGTLIYNLHRALPYPFIFRLVGLIALRQRISRELLNPWIPSEAELKADRWRWALPPEKRKHWDEWGAQVHSLYSAAWAILAALLLGNCTWGSPSPRAWYIFWVLFAATLVGGLVSNYRLFYSISAEMSAGG
jgi:hypothetical protein